MRKKSDCGVTGLIIEDGLENGIVSANNHIKVYFSETL